MSRFYMSADNSRGNQVTAAGASSGQRVHLRGWRNGVEVIGRPDGDRETFDIYATSGSGRGGHRQFIGTVTLNDEGNPQFVPAEVMTS